jgi:membrane protease YdiL (CAAX protease family)
MTLPAGADDGRPGGEEPWGRWSTLGLGLIAMVAAQGATLAVLGLAHLPDFTGDGVAVTLIILISTPIQVGLLWLMARQADSAPARYLGLIWPRNSEIAAGVLAVVAFIVLGNAVSWVAGQDIVTGFQTDIYRTASAAGWLPWLWLVVVVVTPIGEETLFRGFLFRGWHRSARDAWVAIAVTAALFAAVHVQYDLYVIAQVFVSGLMLGWFRWATGSTVLTMLMHGLINCEGMVETAIALHH